MGHEIKPAWNVGKVQHQRKNMVYFCLSVLVIPLLPSHIFRAEGFNTALGPKPELGCQCKVSNTEKKNMLKDFTMGDLIPLQLSTFNNIVGVHILGGLNLFYLPGVGSNLHDEPNGEIVQNIRKLVLSFQILQPFSMEDLTHFWVRECTAEVGLIIDFGDAVEE